jgi:hypothetical protein
MPELTPRIGIKKPLGSENVTRQSFNDNYDIIDNKVVILGDTNQSINKIKALELNIDTRTKQLVKTNGVLTQVIEKDGSTTIKTSTLNYDSNGNLTSVVEVCGENTVTKTLNYINNELDNITKAVV